MNEAVARAHAIGGKRMHAMTDTTMSWGFYQHYGYERRAIVDLLDLYALAMGRHNEQGFVYTLDLAKKVSALEERERDAPHLVPTMETAPHPPLSREDGPRRIDPRGHCLSGQQCKPDQLFGQCERAAPTHAICK